MKVFICTTFRGHWAVGTAAVIVAESEVDAIESLLAKCEESFIPQNQEDINNIDVKELDVLTPGTTILNDGNY